MLHSHQLFYPQWVIFVQTQVFYIVSSRRSQQQQPTHTEPTDTEPDSTHYWFSLLSHWTTLEFFENIHICHDLKEMSFLWQRYFSQWVFDKNFHIWNFLPISFRISVALKLEMIFFSILVFHDKQFGRFYQIWILIEFFCRNKRQI